MVLNRGSSVQQDVDSFCTATFGGKHQCCLTTLHNHRNIYSTLSGHNEYRANLHIAACMADKTARVLSLNSSAGSILACMCVLQAFQASRLLFTVRSNESTAQWHNALSPVLPSAPYALFPSRTLSDGYI